MSDNESNYRVEFQFDASSGITAKSIFRDVQNGLEQLRSAGPGAEAEIDKVQRSLQKLGDASVGGGLSKARKEMQSTAAEAKSLAVALNPLKGLLNPQITLPSAAGIASRGKQQVKEVSAAKSTGPYITYDTQIQEETAARKAASDAIRGQMQAQAELNKQVSIAKSQGPYVTYDSQINEESAARKNASDAIRAQMESQAALNLQGKDYHTLSKQIDDDLARETKARRDASNALRAQLQAQAQISPAREPKNYSNLSNQIDTALSGQQKGTADASALIKAQMQAAAPAIIKAEQEAAKLRTELVGAADAGKLLRNSISTGANSFQGGLLSQIPAVNSLTKATKGASLGMSDLAVHASEAQQAMGNFYPLIVTAGILGTVSKATLGLSVDVVKTSADYEQAFAQVVRTTTVAGGDVGTQIKSIRDGLKDLSSGIPVGFQDLSQIATLGNQLGISADNVVAFTKTVAQFSSVTGVTTEETAKSFGSLTEILGLTSADYDKLGSSITYVGRNSVATEAEVLTMSQKIGATAKQAGFSAEQVIGLSGALSSLREAPERSQGALEKFFSVINESVASGGKSLENFATVIGMTKDQTADLIKTDPYKFFRTFIGSLNQMSSVERTSTLDALGLSGTRVSEVLRRLATNLTVVDSTQADAAKSFQAGSDLAGQYAVTVNTLQSQFTILQNNVNNLLDSLGNAGALSSITNIIKALADVVKNVGDFVDANKGLANSFLIIVTGIGLFAALRTAVVLAAIATTAFQGAAAKVGVQTLFGSVKTLIGALFGVRTAGVAAGTGLGAAATGAFTLRTAVAALFRATILLGVLALVSELVLNTGQSMVFLSNVLATASGVINDVVGSFFNFASGVTAAMSTVAQVIGAAAGTILPVLQTIGNAVSTVFSTISGVQKVLGAAPELVTNIKPDQFKDFQAWAKSLPQDSANVDDFSSSAADLAAQADAMTAGMEKVPGSAIPAADSLGKVGDAAKKAEKEVRTLTDYASDLGTVFDRAFDIRFGPGLAKDDIATQFQAMKDSAQQAAQAITDAKQKIRDIRAEIAGLKADNSQQAYFLSVARAFGDNLRSTAIQATIDKNNSDIAGKSNDLNAAQQDKQKAEDAAAPNLSGNTKGAIDNRKALNDLVDKYKDYIKKLAESGLSQKDLTKKVDEAKKKFEEQAASLGYSKAQVKPYIDALGDLKQIIDKVPRNITVKANADPAIQSLNEFAAKAKSTAANIKASLGGAGGKGITIPGVNVAPTPDNPVIKAALKAELSAYTRQVAAWFKTHDYNTPTVANWMQQIDRLTTKLQGFSSGGYTGVGGKYTPAGIVHKGEYVIPAHNVNQRTGLPYADALGRLVKGQQGRSGYAMGGFVNPDAGMSVVELGPASMRVLRQAVHTEVRAVISAEKTATAVNSVNSNRRRRGGDGG